MVKQEISSRFMRLGLRDAMRKQQRKTALLTSVLQKTVTTEELSRCQVNTPLNIDNTVPKLFKKKKIRSLPDKELARLPLRNLQSS